MALNKDLVVLVDERDEALGTMEKMEAHEKALLHRAFSVLLFNEQNEWLLQRRALDKYHCGGLWTNTCCSHPYPDENTKDAAVRRLQEEMGISCRLEKAFDFIYKASFDNGLTEHEFDHVFIGNFSGDPQINTQEVADWKYISSEDLKKDMATHPEDYTPWFKIIIDKMEKGGYIM
ncbi:isopentenyl-diphosphate Delta-isomerase [Niabella insulamsoli]|uniref:isopentenyl-diphosphate Delta-isomerase n=1 Tax=Niabella insulamsoli TaxID=3144874 RepID=UPI0031FD5914